jgi:hypothetical protein
MEDSLLEDYIHIDMQRVLSNPPLKWIETTFGIVSSVSCGVISFLKLGYFSMYFQNRHCEIHLSPQG